MDNIPESTIKAVAKRLKHYIDVERREDGFDLSQPRNYPGSFRVKSGGTFHYCSLQDKYLQRYLQNPHVRRRLLQLGAIRQKTLDEMDRVRMRFEASRPKQGQVGVSKKQTMKHDHWAENTLLAETTAGLLIQDHGYQKPSKKKAGEDVHYCEQASTASPSPSPSPAASPTPSHPCFRCPKCATVFSPLVSSHPDTPTPGPSTSMRFTPAKYRSPYSQPMIYSYTLRRKTPPLSRWPSNIPPSKTPPPGTPVGSPRRKVSPQLTWDKVRVVTSPTYPQVSFTTDDEVEEELKIQDSKDDSRKKTDVRTTDVTTQTSDVGVQAEMSALQRTSLREPFVKNGQRQSNQKPKPFTPEPVAASDVEQEFNEPEPQNSNTFNEDSDMFSRDAAEPKPVVPDPESPAELNEHSSILDVAAKVVEKSRATPPVKQSAEAVQQESSSSSGSVSRASGTLDEEIRKFAKTGLDPSKILGKSKQRVFDPENPPTVKELFDARSSTSSIQSAAGQPKKEKVGGDVGGSSPNLAAATGYDDLDPYRMGNNLAPAAEAVPDIVTTSPSSYVTERSASVATREDDYGAEENTYPSEVEEDRPPLQHTSAQIFTDEEEETSPSEVKKSGSFEDFFD